MVKDFDCGRCGKSFSDKQSLKFHKRDRHKKIKKNKTKKSSIIIKKEEKKGLSSTHYILIFGIAFIGVTAIMLSARNDTGNQESNNPNVPNQEIHYHPNLVIEIFGEKQEIPADIGISSNVHLPVHTHDNTGELHWEVARPTEENMKLGYFFDIAWRKTFNRDCIFDYCNGDQNGTLKFYVNGELNEEYGNYYVQDRDELLIRFD